MSREVVVLSAGLSTPSSTRLLADQIADAVRSAIGGRGEQVTIQTVELRDLAVEMAQAIVSGGRPTPAVRAAQEAVTRADGVVAVTPVFTASYSGLFKSFLDLLEPGALEGTPVLIAATAGTPRHSLVLDHAMRPLFSYLRAVVVPTGVFAATEDFGGAAGAEELPGRIARAAAELAGLVVGGPQGAAGLGPRPRESEVELAPGSDFAALLRGHDGG